MNRRWVKFTGKAPRFHDPAEATFEVKTYDGNIANGCFWQNSTVMLPKVSLAPFLCCTFHTKDNMPILQTAISHYRRE